MRIKSEVDFWSGVVFIVVGLAFAIGATEYRFGTSARPGPGYFPLGLGLLLAMVGFIELMGALGRERNDADRITSPIWRPMLVIVAAVLGAGFLLPRAGMLITLPLVIVLTCLATSDVKFREAFGLAVVLTVGSWLLFVVALELRIPVMPTKI